MAERRNLGEILLGFGRIEQQDVERALEYQREHGGYFGEALIALDVVSQEELEWSLASQFDLPYVFPEAESIDPEAAALVTAEWALAHLALPIMKTQDTLTVIVDSPVKTRAIEQLSRWTDRRVELALASAPKIRELIRRVYAQPDADEQMERPAPVTLEGGLGFALRAASPRFGISTRRHRSWFWWDDEGTVRRRPLEGLWRQQLDQLVSPPPSREVQGRRRSQLKGHVNRDGIVTPVELRYLSDESGSEYLFRPQQERDELELRFPPPPPGLLSEIRMLARSGSARFVVTAAPESLGHDLLPHLPVLLLDPSWRSIHVHAAGRRPNGDTFSLALPSEPEAWGDELETLRAFHFDCVAVDLGAHAPDWVGAALDVAAVAFLLWREGDDRRAAHDAGIRWELEVRRDDGDRLDWTLRPLHV